MLQRDSEFDHLHFIALACTNVSTTKNLFLARNSQSERLALSSVPLLVLITNIGTYILRLEYTTEKLSLLNQRISSIYAYILIDTICDRIMSDAFHSMLLVRHKDHPWIYKSLKRSAPSNSLSSQPYRLKLQI